MFMEKLKAILDLAIGDGYIPHPKTENANVSFRMNHSYSQKEYLLHKKNLLEEVGIESIYREYVDKKGFKICYVLTKRYPEITQARKMLYINGKKSISREVIEIMDERSLAYLFQDDGGAELTKTTDKKKEIIPYVNNFILNVQSFDENSVNILSNWLKETLIENKIYNRKGYFVISIAKYISKINLCEIVKNHIHKSMLYKINKPLSAFAINY